MLREQAESLISEYAVSEHFLLAEAAAKDQAEGVLGAFFREAAALGLPELADLKGKHVETLLLETMPRLNLPPEAKRAVPDHLEAFFSFLKESGRFPPAGAWRMCVETVKPRYLASLRADGSVKGETFKKNYTDVGRNDPCPCGSGKKFKKCCMELIQ
jgi:hypothetical protein